MKKPRYVVRHDGTAPREWRVWDVKKRAMVAHANTEAAAQAVADEQNANVVPSRFERALGFIAAQLLRARLALAPVRLRLRR